MTSHNNTIIVIDEFCVLTYSNLTRGGENFNYTICNRAKNEYVESVSLIDLIYSPKKFIVFIVRAQNSKISLIKWYTLNKNNGLEYNGRLSEDSNLLVGVMPINYVDVTSLFTTREFIF